MNKIKIIILAMILFNCGCATIKIKDFSASPDIPNASIKGVMNEESTYVWTSFKIVGVNGKPVDYGWTGHFYNSKINLDEGSNNIVVEATRCDGFFKGIYAGRGEISVFLNGGKRYRINGIYDGLIRMWVEDLETNERVSDVINLSVTAKPTDMYIPIFIPQN